MPHRAVDPIVSVAAFIMQIQAMIARNFDPAVGGVVLTFGTISGGTVVNGVAASAKVMGTLRFLDSAQHDLAFKRIGEIAEGVALATGATADVQLKPSPWVPVSNDPGITARFTDYVRSRPHGFRGLRLHPEPHPGHDVLARHWPRPPASLGKVLSR
jgi:N-acetyldiaminopimelate deacetylase